MRTDLIPRVLQDRTLFSSLKASVVQRVFAFTDKRPEFLRQRQFVSLIGSDPVQLKKEDARKYASDKLITLEPFTKETVQAYVNDRSNPSDYRLGLRAAWNKKNIFLNLIPMPDDLISKSDGQATGFPLTRSDSTESLKMDYSSILSSESTPTLTLKKKTGEQSQVPVFYDMVMAVKMTRAFNQHPSVGSQFILQLGDHTGLYEAPRGNDVVFTPLSETSESNYERSGTIESWSDQAALIKADAADEDSFKTILALTARGGYTPASSTVFNTAGMMSCDARHSITGYLECLDELEASEETDPAKIFNSSPKANPVWEPSIEGGRGIPAKKKMNWEQKMLSADNETIHKVVQYYEHENAKRDQILTVRRKMNSDGAPIVLNKTTAEKISIILGFEPPASFDADEFFGKDFQFSLE